MASAAGAELGEVVQISEHSQAPRAVKRKRLRPLEVEPWPMSAYRAPLKLKLE